MDNQKTIICRDIHNNEYPVTADNLKFRPSVYGILIEGNKILLSKQWDGYDFPGGGIETHETIDEALCREFFEETGLSVEVDQILHAESSFFHPNHAGNHRDEFWNCLLLVYLVKRTGGELSKDNFDEYEKEYADMPEWIGLDKISDIKFINPFDCLLLINTAKARLNET